MHMFSIPLNNGHYDTAELQLTVPDSGTHSQTLVVPVKPSPRPMTRILKVCPSSSTLALGLGHTMSILIT